VVYDITWKVPVEPGHFLSRHEDLEGFGRKFDPALYVIFVCFVVKTDADDGDQFKLRQLN
jgi:hypothetical protein